MTAKWKAITVDLPKDIVVFKKVLAEEMGGATTRESVVAEAHDDFEDFVSTFSPKNKAEIELEPKIKANSVEVFTGVTSRWEKGKKANAKDIFMFLARGTSKRYATMASNFKAKSRKGVIKSGSGGGQRTPLYVNTAKPNKGIESRDIEETVKNKNESSIVRKTQVAVEKTAQIVGVKKLL